MQRSKKKIGKFFLEEFFVEKDKEKKKKENKFFHLGKMTKIENKSNTPDKIWTIPIPAHFFHPGKVFEEETL